MVGIIGFKKKKKKDGPPLSPISDKYIGSVWIERIVTETEN